MQKSVIAIAAWCLYDWACASFSIIVTTFIFATYFTTKVADNPINGTYQWANATSMAGLIIAFSSPLVGAIADHGGHHKKWMLAFTLMCIISAALLWFAYPNSEYTYSVLLCVVIGTVGLEIALVFYNAFLPHLAPQKYLGRISGWGWGSGYIGGILALSIALIFIRHKFSWIDTTTYEQIRICGPLTAVWYGLFALPFFMLVPAIPIKSKPFWKAIIAGWHELKRTLKKLPHERNIFLYLISHMIYTDGLNTLFAFGGIYAAGTYGLTFEEVLLLGITMNITAGFGAVTLAFMDDLIGSKPTVILSLVCLALFGIPLLLLHSKIGFWIVSLVMCLFVGPVQSASRTLMVRLMERKSMSTEMFGLYALSGKITAFIGPWILGWVTLMFDSQRVGMATILVFFVIGAITLIPVKMHH